MTCGIPVVRAYWGPETPLCKAPEEDPGTETLGRLACVPLWHLEDDYVLYVSALMVQDYCLTVHRRKPRGQSTT